MEDKFATLFGGALNDTSTPEYLDSVKIGKTLVEKGYVLKSGGYRGLMEAFSKGGKEAGGEVIGVTCQSFGSTKGNDYLDINIQAADIFDRLRELMDSEIFVVQKGGIGTLSELFLLWDIIRKKKDLPPVYLIGAHWNEIILSVFDLTSYKERSMLTVVGNADQFIEYLD